MDDLALRLQKASEKHCGGGIPHDLGLHLVSVIFASDGKEEDRWIEDMENACPYCGGSGHKDDCADTEARHRAELRQVKQACARIAAEWEETWDRRDDPRASVGVGLVFRDIRDFKIGDLIAHAKA